MTAVLERAATRALEPNFTVERFAKVYPIKHDSDREHYMKGLRLAGVPER